MEKNNMRHDVWRSLRDGDFQEDDVWDVLGSTKPSFSSQTLLPSEPVLIPKRQSREGMSPTRQHSVPVSVPDWSLAHRRKTKKVDDDDDEDDDDDDDEKVSPKEYFLRRSQSSWSASVMEGVGRKLKGRDLSKVRNAILKKTGFLE